MLVQIFRFKGEKERKVTYHDLWDGKIKVGDYQLLWRKDMDNVTKCNDIPEKYKKGVPIMLSDVIAIETNEGVDTYYVGQSEKQLRKAFDTAEDLAPCVLWIDEIEKGLNVRDSSGTTTTMTGQFLFWLQECKKQVFVVATANNISQLPAELLRRVRFDEIFFVDLPTAKERGEIITLYMDKYLDLEMTEGLLNEFVEVTEGFTGADIESAIRDLAYHTISNDGFIVDDEEIVFNAFRKILPLSQVNPEQIENIRMWGIEHAIPASGIPINTEQYRQNRLIRGK